MFDVAVAIPEKTSEQQWPYLYGQDKNDLLQFNHFYTGNISAVVYTPFFENQYVPSMR